MPDRNLKSEFPEHTEENRGIWDANALWWDDKIGDGNEHQTVLIDPQRRGFSTSTRET